LRGLSVDGLKADLQQCLLETVDNTAATTHTTNTAREGTVNTKDNTGNADNAALPTELPTHAKRTMNTEETDKNADNAMMHTETLGLRSVCNIATVLPTNTPNDKDDVGISEDSDDNSSSSSSKKSSSSSSDTESSNSNNGIPVDDNMVSMTNFPI
jgi:hypothetical protein